MHHPVAQGVTQKILSMENSLEVLPIGKNLWAFHRQRGTPSLEGDSVSNPLLWADDGIHSGFVDDENLERLLQHQPFRRRKLVVLTDDELERARCMPLSHALENTDWETRCPWEMFLGNPELTASNVVEVDWGAHMLLDPHGEPLPTALVFSYPTSGIDETTYDLPLLAQALLNRDDVRVCGCRGWRDWLLENTVEEAIHPIAGDYDRHSTVQFVWQPSRADFLQVWAWAKQATPSYPSVSLVAGFFALDIAGLAHARRSWSQTA